MKCLMLLSGCCSVCGFRPEKKDGDRLSASVYLRPLKLGDRKEPQLLAGIVGDLRLVNGKQGRVAIFKLDDGSSALEIVVKDDVYEATRQRMAVVEEESKKNW